MNNRSTLIPQLAVARRSSTAARSFAPKVVRSIPKISADDQHGADDDEEETIAVDLRAADHQVTTRQAGTLIACGSEPKMYVAAAVAMKTRPIVSITCSSCDERRAGERSAARAASPRSPSRRTRPAASRGTASRGRSSA